MVMQTKWKTTNTFTHIGAFRGVFVSFMCRSDYGRWRGPMHSDLVVLTVRDYAS
jgi:hypothetical protein